ncbi:hypothetical protein F4604DRAFT_1676540 [Suillus subluteus]|nr:hypothetical protein F4604DRAFT_1676540 [Suillus subluteus]
MSETQRQIHIEQEDIQTACDSDLFDEDDDMEGAESQTTTQFDTPRCTMAGLVSAETSRMNLEEPMSDVADQPSTWTTQLDKRGASEMDLDNVTDQPPTDPLGKRAKQVTDAVLPDKRRIKEVDYSETLRQTMYSQEELINNMKTEVEKQRKDYAHNMNEMKQQWETTLREREEQLAKAQEETERTRVQQQQQLEEYIKKTREALGQANREAIEATIKKIHKDAHDHLARERTRQEAELSEKLAQREEELKRKTNEEAEKESELAKMERRFSTCHRPQEKDIEMDNPIMPSPSAKPRSDTSCFEAIRRIKRTRGTSHRVRLVSVAAEVDEEEVPQEHSSEQDAPPHLQHDMSPATTMENAIARGVEAALRRILIDKEFPVIKKHSPWRRKMEEKELQQEKAADKSYERDFILGEVRRLFKDVFNMSQDADFILHQAASREDVYSYEYEDGPGPDCEDLAFDLRCGSKSPWNDKVIGLLLEELQRRGDQESWPFQRSEPYFREILQDRYKRLRTVWTAAQPKVTAMGGLETPAEVEQRLITKKDETLKATHQTTRRKNKYLRRVMVLNHLVKHKTDENEEDVPAWQWLQFKADETDTVSRESNDIQKRSGWIA